MGPAGRTDFNDFRALSKSGTLRFSNAFQSHSFGIVPPILFHDLAARRLASSELGKRPRLDTGKFRVISTRTNRACAYVRCEKKWRPSRNLTTTLNRSQFQCIGSVESRQLAGRLDYYGRHRRRRDDRMGLPWGVCIGSTAVRKIEAGTQAQSSLRLK